MKTSVFSTRYHCLKIEKKDTEDYMEYTGRVNEQCEKAKLQELDKDGLKALLWIYGLKSNRDAELRQRLLMFLDRKYSDQKTVTLHDLYKGCDLWLNIKREAKMVETGAQEVNMVRTRNDSGDSNDTTRHSELLCWNCGKGGHISRKCQSKKWNCGKCKRLRTQTRVL